MSVTTYTHYALPPGSNLANRPPGAFVKFACSTLAELPVVNVMDGDTADVQQTGLVYAWVAGAWAEVGAFQAWPVGAIFVSDVPTLPNVLLGYGVWLAKPSLGGMKFWQRTA